MIEKRTRLMDTDEIARVVGCTRRHAQRLRASRDSRAYGEDFDYEPPTPRKPDMMAVFNEAIEELDGAVAKFYAPYYNEAKYSGAPINLEDIYDAFHAVLDSLKTLRAAIGPYSGRDGAGGEWCNGLPTIYDRARLGLPVHFSYKPTVLKWAEKFNQPIRCEFFSEPGDEKYFDSDGNDLPETDEPIVSGAESISATVSYPSAEEAD